MLIADKAPIGEIQTHARFAVAPLLPRSASANGAVDRLGLSQSSYGCARAHTESRHSINHRLFVIIGKAIRSSEVSDFFRSACRQRFLRSHVVAMFSAYAPPFHFGNRFSRDCAPGERQRKKKGRSALHGLNRCGTFRRPGVIRRAAALRLHARGRHRRPPLIHRSGAWNRATVSMRSTRSEIGRDLAIA